MALLLIHEFGELEQANHGNLNKQPSSLPKKVYILNTRQELREAVFLHFFLMENKLTENV